MDLEGAAQDAWNALSQFPAGGRGLWHQVVARTLLLQGAAQEARTVLDRGLVVFPGDSELRRLRDGLSD